MKHLRSAATALALAALLPLGACSKADEDTAGQQQDGKVDRTLAAAIADAPDLSQVSSALSDSGLAGVFDGPGSYTVLAPDDDAFGKLAGQEELTSGEGKPVLVAVLRDHILPGHLTVDAIRKAIEDNGGPVEMRTLGDGTVTFSLEGERIAIAGDNGMNAHVEGAALPASNGVVIPIDGLLKAPKPVG
jgi:uncharacterized surface protein with fasciclin (FAS1) repeats